MKAIPGTTMEFSDERIGAYINYQYNAQNPEENDMRYMLSQEQADNMLGDMAEFIRKYYPWIQDFVIFQYPNGTIRMDLDYMSMLHFTN